MSILVILLAFILKVRAGQLNFAAATDAAKGVRLR
jgi:hypothetical protein